MTKFILKKFIQNSDDISDTDVRKAYGIVSGSVGVVCNIFLFVFKLLAGVITSSIAITADAFNNLSDAGSSIVTIIGFKLADKPADEDHPFGHGRIEYIAGFIVSLIILLVGFELVKTSVEKIINPTNITFKITSVIIMVLSVLVKLWMCVFNRYLGKKINSSAISAVAADSLNDVIATTSIIIGLFVCLLFNVNIDGFLGFAVALFIIKSGLDTAKDTIDPLLGQSPEPEFVKAIEKEVMSFDGIVGIHDLIVHNYGPGRLIISLHAEVPSNDDIIKIHDTIDNIEKHLNKKFKCESVIHMDPIVIDNEKVTEVYHKTKSIVTHINEQLSIHDFRMVDGPSHTNLIFDVVVPWDFEIKNSQLYDMILKEIKAYDESYNLVINFDKSYV